MKKHKEAIYFLVRPNLSDRLPRCIWFWCWDQLELKHELRNIVKEIYNNV
jgi:hypothetical protein